MTEESTTPDLVEVVRRLFEASNRRDFDAVMRFYAPDGVWEATGIGQSFDGEAAIRGLYEDWVGGYEKHEIVLDEGKTSATESYLPTSHRAGVSLAVPATFDRAKAGSSGSLTARSCG